MKKLLFILLIVCGLNVVAGTYKWKDANGSLHYSDKPAPAGIKAETFKLKSTVTSAAPDAINKNKTTESKVTVLTKDPLLTPLQQKGFEEYLEEKSDKVFAICLKNSTCASYGISDVDKAMTNCNKRYNNKCQVYAINNEVVIKK